MLAYADDEALRRTRETGEAWFWSRSRRELWHKGATSGNTMAVEEIRDDCDGDALLYRVRPNGPACHTGAESCFSPWLWRIVAERAATRPAGSYVAEPARGRAGRAGAQGGGGGGRGGARRGERERRAARRGARRPLVPLLRPARGAWAAAVRRRGRATPASRELIERTRAEDPPRHGCKSRDRPRRGAARGRERVDGGCRLRQRPRRRTADRRACRGGRREGGSVRGRCRGRGRRRSGLRGLRASARLARRRRRERGNHLLGAAAHRDERGTNAPDRRGQRPRHAPLRARGARGG